MKKVGLRKLNVGHTLLSFSICGKRQDTAQDHIQNKGSQIWEGIDIFSLPRHKNSSAESLLSDTFKTLLWLCSYLCQGICEKVF